MVRSARFDEVPPRVAYAILRLRVDVFVVEQACAYAELDGRDLEPDCIWVWAANGDRVTGTLRVLTDPGGARRIGRVATAGEARGRGVAAALMHRALELVGDAESVLDAQSHLTGWYARFGYRADGPRFVEDGIDHTPMRRPAART